MRNNIQNNNNGFTLAELLIATAVMAIVFSGVIISFIRCMELSEMARNSSIAMSAVKSRMSAISNTDFTQILATYDNQSFTNGGINGRGVSYVTALNNDLLVVTVAFSWQQRSGLVVGEDLDLDGVIDSGEDINVNGILDSPVSVSSLIYDE